MGNLKIGSGIERITINDDPDRVIEFDPSEVGFVERFYKVYHEFEEKQAEFEKRSKALDAEKDNVDENGVPVNIGEGIALMKDVCSYMRDRIDYVFGQGTSQVVFGDALSMERIGEFFEGMTPFVQANRSEKMAKYLTKKTSGRVMKK
jgi:hypothetical protein